MGYYTNFELSVHQGTADLEAVKNKLDDVMAFSHDESIFDIREDDEFAVQPTRNVIASSDSCKWYDHDEDCAKMSQSFPGVVFKLHGEGEETGDLWNAYYKDGLCQICRAKFVFPEFDENKLMSVQDAQGADGSIIEV